MTRNESTEREGQPRGRYYAEHVWVTGSNPEAQLQSGVGDGLADAMDEALG